LIGDAIDGEEVSFYAKYGFQVFPAGAQTLSLPMAAVRAAIHL
jgi:hypothetical protein